MGGQERPAERVDALARFNQAILIIRWGTTAAALALAASDTGLAGRYLACALALTAYTALRTFRPLRYEEERAGLAAVLLEVGGTALAVAATGYWESPFVFTVLTAVAVAGFARGFAFALRIAVAVILGISIPWFWLDDLTEDQSQTTMQWAAEVLLVAVVAGYTRLISGEADRRQSLALDRLGRLSDANSLLFRLHAVTQTLPASLDLEEVLDNTVAQLGDLFEHDALVVLLAEETDGCWHTARRNGPRPPSQLTTEELPPPLARALRSRSAVLEADLAAAGGPGLVEGSASGVYAVLPARGSVIGLVAIEHRTPDHFRSRDAELLAGFVEAAALAIDNCRWFARLRTVGATEERARIARDLHDRIGQSLAYLAFELDRIVKASAEDAPLKGSLEHLRDDIRGVIREVRDTLYDLRTDVTDSQSLPTILAGFLDRVRERSGLEVEVLADETGRLPILQERELWRLAQEAVTNVERHARATSVEIRWRSDGNRASLEVVDDGVGFAGEAPGRVDSYGMMGMRERAASIGATLTIESVPGKGTRVRCDLAGP